MFVIRTKVWKINPVLADLRLSQENLCTLNFKLKHVNESGTLLYEHSTMNVDCGLHINSIWNPIFTHPSLWETTNPPSSLDRPWLTSASFWLVTFLKNFKIHLSVHICPLCHHYVHHYLYITVVLVIPLMKILWSKRLDFLLEVQCCAM